LLAVLDSGNNVDLWRLEAGGVVAVGTQQLVAEERLQLEQRRVYDQLPADPRLLIEINHAHPGQVELQLRAPSGQQALLSLSAGTMVREGVFAFDFERYAELKKLLVAERSGNWTLVLTDLEAGTAGDTLGWSIVDTKTSELEAAYRVLQPVPEPRTTVNATSRLSKDGRLGLSWPEHSSTAGPILVWDIAADAVLARVPRNPDTLEALFVMNGSRVLTVSSTQVVLWDSQSGRRVGQIKLDEPLSASITLAPNERFAALPARRKDKTRVVDVWDLKKMQRIGRVVAAADASKLAIDSSGKHLAIGGRDAWVRVWSMQSGELVREFAHSAPLRSLQFDQQGDWLATDDLSSTLRIWNVQSGRVPLIERVGNSAWNIHFANDSGSVLFGSYDRAYQVVSLPDGRDAGVRLGHPAVGRIGRDAGRKQRVFVLSELQLAITSDTNRNVKVWKLPAAPPATQISKLMPGNMRTALSPDGQRIAVGATVADVRIYAAGAPGSLLLNALSDARPEEAGEVSSEIVRLVFSADRSLLASGSMDGIVRLWESASGRRLSLSVLHPDGPVHDLLFGADGHLLFSASRLEVQVTDLLVGATIARLRIQADNPQLALAEEATELFIADDQNGVTRWNWKDSISDRVVSGDYQVRKIAVAPDGSRLVTAGADLSLRLWDVANGVQVGQSMTAAGKVDDLWLVGDGKRLVVHAGHWLHSVIVSSAGLAPRHTRFLDAVPAAVQPDAAGIEVYMLSPSPPRPTLGRLALADPPEVEMAGEPEQLRDYWRARLALSLQPDGQVQPVSMAVPLVRP
jgi:WD40 repeat protein